MDNEYKELLVRSIQSQEAMQKAVETLTTTSRTINDNLASHNNSIAELCKLAQEGNKLSEANNILLIKYLKWAIFALVVTLGGAKLINELSAVAGAYGL
jgi:hypothetical protein